MFSTGYHVLSLMAAAEPESQKPESGDHGRSEDGLIEPSIGPLCSSF